MNNWRLLLLAVVAVLQPNGSLTESNLIDGSRGCCDHRSTTQETSLYGNYRKNTLEDRRLNTLPIREDSRRLQVDQIVRSRERLSVERTDRRVIPDSTVRLNTERFVTGQDRRQRSVETREPRQTREDRIRRTREHISRDSLTHYERDALDSRRAKISRDDARIGSDTTRTVRDANEYRRVSAIRETMERNRNNVARNEIRRDSRIDTFRFGNRVQDNNERRSFDRRARENVDETRRSRSAESRESSVYAENRRSISERVDDRSREFRDRTLNQRDSSDRLSRNSIERQDQTRRDIREKSRINENRQQSAESRISGERASEFRESIPITEHRLARESQILNENVRLVSNGKTEIRREIARDLERVFRDRLNERRLGSQHREATRVLAIMRSDETREDRRQPLTRSLDRVDVRSVSRSNEREVRISGKAVRVERAARNRREVRSVLRMDDNREKQYESRMYRERQMANLVEFRDSSERRQDTRRTVSSYRVDVNARLERESRLREIRGNKRSHLNLREREELSREQVLIRQTRDTERRDDIRISRNLRSTERASDEVISRMRDIRSERSESRARVGEARRLTRDISAPTERLDTRRTSRIVESESRMQRARTLENIRDERREVRKRDESRFARDRVFMARLARERIGSQDYKVREIRDSRIDIRYEISRNRGVHMHRFDARDESENRSRNLALPRQSRDILDTRSAERRPREASRDVQNRAERLNSFGNRESNDVRFEAKQRSTDASRPITRREIETRFRNYAAKEREADSVDENYGQGAMSWQMVFYTLQGAYLCGLLMQMLNEKSNKGKTRNFAWWSSAKELIKVD